MKRNKIAIFLSLLFLVLCYYLYYTYYINLFVSGNAVLLNRTDISMLTSIDFEEYRSVAKEIKITNGIFFLIMFGIGYSYGTFALYGRGSVLIVLVSYSIILIVSGVFFLYSMSTNNGLIYCAGAEIKNFVWSPIFFMLIVLLPQLHKNHSYN